VDEEEEEEEDDDEYEEEAEEGGESLGSEEEGDEEEDGFQEKKKTGVLKSVEQHEDERNEDEGDNAALAVRENYKSKSSAGISSGAGGVGGEGDDPGSTDSVARAAMEESETNADLSVQVGARKRSRRAIVDSDESDE